MYIYIIVKYYIFLYLYCINITAHTVQNSSYIHVVSVLYMLTYQCVYMCILLSYTNTHPIIKSEFAILSRSSFLITI